MDMQEQSAFNNGNAPREQDEKRKTDRSMEENNANEDDATAIGAKVITDFGLGVVTHHKEFDGEWFISVSLKSGGSCTMPRAAVSKLRVVKVERKKKKPLPLKPKGGRVLNIIGHIRMYNPTKGWGFVICADYDGDVFLHSKHILGNPPPEYIGHFNSCSNGHCVKFDLDLYDYSRPQALNVRMIGGALGKKEAKTQGDTGRKEQGNDTGRKEIKTNGDYHQLYDLMQDGKLHSRAPSLHSDDELGWGTMNGKGGRALREADAQRSKLLAAPSSLSKNQPGDWYCPNPNCLDVQFSRNLRCRVCGTPKPGNVNGRNSNQKGKTMEPVNDYDEYPSSNGQYPSANANYQSQYYREEKSKPPTGNQQGYMMPYLHRQSTPRLANYDATYEYAPPGYMSGYNSLPPQYHGYHSNVAPYHQQPSQSPYPQHDHQHPVNLMHGYIHKNGYDSPRAYDIEYLPPPSHPYFGSIHSHPTSPSSHYYDTVAGNNSMSISALYSLDRI